MLFDSKWITYKTGEYKSAEDKYGNPAPYFRRAFSVSGEVASATVFASALGVFKLYINGEEVDSDYLSPGWVDYHKKLPFVRYDITDKIRETNALGVILSDGWAVGHLGSTYAFRRCGYSDRVEFSALVRIEYADGRVEEIPTDSTWRAKDGAIRRSDIYMGELVDRRLDLGDFSSPHYDDTDWDYAEETVFKFSRNLYLSENTAPRIRVKHRFTPTLIWKRDGTYLYDASQNIAGVLSLSLRGNRGDRVTVRHGELLSGGELYTENLRKAEATDVFILSGEGVETFRPLFTYHGFRYAEITVEGDVGIVDIVAEAMYADLTPSGDFSTSDPIVNKIYQNALWSQRDNFLTVPTDCPQRDERLGWTGDAQIFARSAMWNMNCKSFFEKYLADIRDAQLGNGVIPAVAPVPPVGSYAYTGREAAAGWCEAIAEIPYAHYIMYGDVRVLKDNIYALKKLLEYYATESPTGIRSGKGAYGDWLSLGTPSDISAVSTLYYVRAVALAERICRIIGDSDADTYAELLLSLKSAFRRELMDENERIISDTQSLYCMAYKFGVIDLESARKNLERKMTEDGMKLTTGFLGIRFLLPTLCDIGRSDIAYSLLSSREYPGWGYSVVNGATTVWEHWDSYTEADGIRAGMNSFNHYSFGSCTEWMFEYCLGIRPSEDGGFSRITLCPCIDFTGKITSANGRYDTPFGRIEASWRTDGDTATYEVDMPEEIKWETDFSAYSQVECISNGKKMTFKIKK